MDILSLGKASKVLRDIEALDEQLVAPKAESRFNTVDERLDWLEAQADQIKIEQVHNVDLSQGTFENTEFVDEKIQLKQISPGEYSSSGTYESPIIDLGEGWNGTTLAEVVKQVSSTVGECLFEVATSNDGLAFSEYALFDTTAAPQARFLKLKATLTSTPIPGEEVEYAFDQPEENKVMLNDFTQAAGQLKLNTAYTPEVVTGELLGSGQLYRTGIQKSNFKRINTLEIK